MGEGDGMVDQVVVEILGGGTVGMAGVTLEVRRDGVAGSNELGDCSGN